MKDIDIKNFPKYFLDKLILKEKDIHPKLKLPMISVVMPSFNQAEYIEKSILSVLNQNYPQIELIIIDGGSKDGTVDIIKKYDSYINYWISEKDGGQSDALNKGFKVCKGEILCWLNSDDLYLPGALSCAAELLSNNKEKKICYGDWISIDKNEKTIDTHYAFDVSINHLKYEGFHFNAQSFFWRKDVHKNFSGFDIKLNKTMDYQMMLEFALEQSESSFIRINKVLAAFRRYPSQKTGNYNLEEHLEHKYLSSRYGYEDKYYLTGKVKKFFFRCRRAIWYFKRGGIKEIIKRLFK